MTARRALALASATVALAGCGRTYSDAAVQAAVEGAPHGFTSSSYGAIHSFGDRGERPFATWDAVTELRIDPPLLAPTNTFSATRGLVLVRFGSAHQAWQAEPVLRALGSRAGPQFGIDAPYAARRDNVVAIGNGRAATEAALARLP